MYSTRVDNKVYDEEYIRFAKPEEVGMTKKCFQSTSKPVEMSFDFLYTPPSGTVNIPQKIEKVEEGIIPIGDRGTGTASEGTFVQLLSRGPHEFVQAHIQKVYEFRR